MTCAYETRDNKNINMDVANLQLDGNADAVEFCPHPPFHHVLAAATYTLKEGDDQPSRSGSISLFDTNNGLDLLHRVETPGVFDIKWNSYGSNTQPFLAQVDATGSLSLYQLLDNNPGIIKLKFLITLMNLNMNMLSVGLSHRLVIQALCLDKFVRKKSVLGCACVWTGTH